MLDKKKNMLEKIRLKELNDLYGSFRYKDEIYKIISPLKDVDLIKGTVNRVIACKNKATGKYKIIDVGKNGDEIIFVKTSIIPKNREDSDYYVDLTDIRLTHINPKMVECLKGHKIRLDKGIEKELLKFVFCEYELNIGTYHPFLLSKKCYFNDFYEKDGHTYTCFTAEGERGEMYPFEIKDYLYAGQDVILKFDII